MYTNLPTPQSATTCPAWCSDHYDDRDGVTVRGHEGTRRIVAIPADDVDGHPTVAGVSALLLADDCTPGPLVLLTVTEGGSRHAAIELPLAQVRRVADVLVGLLVDAAS